MDEQELSFIENLLSESFAPFQMVSTELNWLDAEIHREKKYLERIRRWKIELVAALVFWSFLFLSYESWFSGITSIRLKSEKGLAEQTQASINPISSSIQEASVKISSENKPASEIFFQKMKKVFKSERLRGEVIAVSANGEEFLLNKGSVDYLEVGSEVVIYQEQLQTVAKIIQLDPHQAICRLPSSQPIKSGAYFFAMIQRPQLQPHLSTTLQGTIAWVASAEIGIEQVPGSVEMNVGDFFSVYREQQKIGVVLLSEMTQDPIAHLIYQTVPFQKGDRVVLEVQSKHFLTESL